jgi:polar amino acid transport system substrate-binding protein
MPRPENLADLVGLRGRAPFGINFGQEQNEYAIANLAIDSAPYDEIKTDLRNLAENRTDYILMSRSFGLKAVEAARLNDAIVDLPWSLAGRSVHFMFSRNSPCRKFVTDFNLAIEDGKQTGRLAQLLAGYGAPGDLKLDDNTVADVSR